MHGRLGLWHCVVPAWWRCSGGCCWPKRVSGSPLLLPFHVSTSSQPLRPASALWHVTEIQLHQPIFNHLLYVCLAFFLRLKAGHQKLLASRGVMYQGMCGVTLKTRRRLFINCSLLSCPGRLLRTHMSLSVLQLFVQEFERGKKSTTKAFPLLLKPRLWRSPRSLQTRLLLLEM